MTMEKLMKKHGINETKKQKSKYQTKSSMCGSAATKNMPAEFVYIPRHLLNDRSVVEKAIRSQ